jgi:hypothetical protein
MFPLARAAVTLTILLMLMALTQSFGDEPSQQPVPKTKQLGVVLNEPGAFQGYTLVFPRQSKKTYLIDMQGRIVHSWESKYVPGQEAYLLENGHLLRPATLSNDEALFTGAGGGGRIQEFTWEGEIVWNFKFHNEKQIQHHSITRMPNGNMLLIVWERKIAKQVIEAGVKPEAAGSGEKLIDSLVEIKPMGPLGGQIIWEWHMWDHLVQDQDKSKSNYGNVALHSELVDVNYVWSTAFGNIAQFAAPPSPKGDVAKPPAKNDALNKLKGIGYLGAVGGKKSAGVIPDWTHVNSVSYNAKFDQILLSVRSFSEIWIIDHSTTTAEAASHSGGRGGKGGDILYRWGNPAAFRAGAASDQKLFVQHDASWIPDGVPGAGHILVFSNGSGRPDGNYSSVDEIVPPVDAKGKYTLAVGGKFGPEGPVWTYTAPKKSDFFAPLMSGAQRLPNGNTLICTGYGGAIFEVTPKAEVVWKYIVPNDAGSGLGALINAGAFFGGRTEGNPVFRAYRYGKDYPGLTGRDLTPGKTLEELQAK